jgi:alkanesulfonate monooxygenase SsuD/methylene tetrahydromethanopterin reductase-like flavin-dependent oxidoreductase (luciferase family)
VVHSAAAVARAGSGRDLWTNPRPAYAEDSGDWEEMTVSALEFGWRMATFSADGTPGSTLVAQVEEHLRRLDGQLRAVWVQDHLMPEAPWTLPSWDSLEAWSTLCHWAAAFPSYHFGTIVLANSYRSPALLAKMAATTQILTRGRLILGLGAGWHEPEYRAYGYDFPPTKERIGQLAEAVQLIRTMWTESPATFRGQYFRVEQAFCNPRPNPAPPIMIGGAGEQLTLRLVARHADWYNVPSSPLEVVARKLAVLREHCSAVGRDYDSIVKTGSINAVAVAPSRAEAQRLAEGSPFYRPEAPSASAVGEPGDVAEQLRRYADLGISHLIIRFADFPRLDGAMRFVEQVLPLVRETDA